MQFTLFSINCLIFYIFNILSLYTFRFFHPVYDVTSLLSAQTFPYIPGILNVASSATRRAAAGIILHLFIFISLSEQFSFNMLVSCVIQRCQEYFREIVVESFIRKTSMSTLLSHTYYLIGSHLRVSKYSKTYRKAVKPFRRTFLTNTVTREFHSYSS